MFRLFTPFCVILAIGVLSFCEDAATLPPSEVGLPAPAAVINDFPNKVGSRWTYSYFDSLAGVSDTVLVKIVAETVINWDVPATVWQRIFRNRIDTLYVVVSGDTVRVIPKANISWQWMNTKYVFPFAVGKGWRGDFVSDTSTVMDRGSVSVISGTFFNAFRIEERWGLLNDHGLVSTWFAPKVGTVKMFRREWGFGAVRQTWELIDYHVVL